jgi:hypothetical protein
MAVAVQLRILSPPDVSPNMMKGMFHRRRQGDVTARGHLEAGANFARCDCGIAAT